jgi:hypothetical protein
MEGLCQRQAGGGRMGVTFLQWSRTKVICDKVHCFTEKLILIRMDKTIGIFMSKRQRMK